MRTIVRLVTAALLGLALLSPAPSAHAASRSPLTVGGHSPALAGESVTLSGSLPQSRSRRYVVQRQTVKGWVHVTAGRTDRAGRYRSTVRVTRTTTLRVHAPAQGRLVPRSSVKRTVRTVTDRSTVALLDQGWSRTARVTLTAPRPGRPISVETRAADGTWRVAGSGTTPTGTRTTSVSLGPLTPGTLSLRMRMPAWRGAKAYTSSTTRATVAAPVVEPPDPTPPAEPSDPPSVVTLPQVDITTSDAAPVDSREVWVHGTVSVDGTAHATRIRGRGNSTWGQPKKPYRLRLDAASGLLGLPSDRDWVLLANYFDRSHLRNATAFEVAARTRMAWTPTTRHVNVTLNGRPLGLYVLTEHVRASSNRVALATGGVFAEVDERLEANAEPGFRTRHGTALVLKEPEAVSDERAVAFREHVERFEDSLYGRSEDDAWRDMIDEDSFVDWYLVNELFKNVDADFFSSVFVTWDPTGGGRLSMGPVWDFDLTAGLMRSNAPSLHLPEGWWLRGGASTDETHARHDDHWLATMLRDDAFAARVAQRWSELSHEVAGVVAALDARADAIAPHAEADLRLWPESADLPMSHHPTFRGEVAQLRTWLADRRTWLDAQLLP